MFLQSIVFPSIRRSRKARTPERRGRRGGGGINIVRKLSSIQFSSVQCLDRVGRRGDRRDDSAAILFQSFSAGGPCEQSWLGQGCPLFDVVHPAFSLPITASPTLQGAVKDDSGEAVVACGIS